MQTSPDHSRSESAGPSLVPSPSQGRAAAVLAFRRRAEAMTDVELSARSAEVIALEGEAEQASIDAGEARIEAEQQASRSGSMVDAAHAMTQRVADDNLYVTHAELMDEGNALQAEMYRRARLRGGRVVRPNRRRIVAREVWDLIKALAPWLGVFLLAGFVYANTAGPLLSQEDMRAAMTAMFAAAIIAGLARWVGVLPFLVRAVDNRR